MNIGLKYAEEWSQFINEVATIRKELNCSKLSAWFRGQTDTDWDLTPSLFRFGVNKDPDDSNELKKIKKSIKDAQSSWKEALAQKVKLKKTLQNLKDEQEPVLKIKKYNTRETYHHIVNIISKYGLEIKRHKRRLSQFNAPVGGEREIFEEYIFNASRSNFKSSWEVLGEMRHYGIPTRLLDWTDRLDIALYFALDKYREVYEASESNEEYFKNCSSHPSPCLWVLNPFSFSKKITGRTSIWDVVQQSELDYYDRLLIQRNWDYDEPIPIYPPSYFDRIKAQNGFFVAYGNDHKPMNKQKRVNNKLLRKIEISPSVALYGIEYLKTMQGLNRFSIFRDLDSLGQELTNKFIRYQNWRTKTEHNKP